MGLTELVICDACLDRSGCYCVVVVDLLLEVERRFLRKLLVACCVHHLHLKFCLGLVVDCLFLLIVELVRYWILQGLRSFVSLRSLSTFRMYGCLSVIAKSLGPRLRGVVGQMLGDLHCALEVEPRCAIFSENFSSAPRAFYMSLTQRYTANFDDHSLTKLGRQ